MARTETIVASRTRHENIVLAYGFAAQRRPRGATPGTARVIGALGRVCERNNDAHETEARFSGCARLDLLLLCQFNQTQQQR
jgi:hypothetical protein